MQWVGDRISADVYGGKDGERSAGPLGHGFEEDRAVVEVVVPSHFLRNLPQFASLSFKRGVRFAVAPLNEAHEGWALGPGSWRQARGEGVFVEARSAEGGIRPLKAARESERRVARMVERHGAVLMRVARHLSLCQDDALDAYQRALEIYLRRVDSLDPATELA
jgi:hypothetical protein